MGQEVRKAVAMSQTEKVRLFSNTGTTYEQARQLVRRASRVELEDMLQSVASWPDRYNMALAERERRSSRWVTVGVVAAIISAIFAVIAAIPQMRGWFAPAHLDAPRSEDRPSS